jgi:hypothetical protein
MKNNNLTRKTTKNNHTFLIKYLGSLSLALATAWSKLLSDLFLLSLLLFLSYSYYSCSRDSRNWDSSFAVREPIFFVIFFSPLLSWNWDFRWIFPDVIRTAVYAELVGRLWCWKGSDTHMHTLRRGEPSWSFRISAFRSMLSQGAKNFDKFNRVKVHIKFYQTGWILFKDLVAYSSKMKSILPLKKTFFQSLSHKFMLNVIFLFQSVPLSKCISIYIFFFWLLDFMYFSIRIHT